MTDAPPRPPKKGASRPRRAKPAIERFRLGSETFYVLSKPMPSPLTSLTASERAVLVALLDGASNQEIAKMRGVAVRTVANQVRAILQKHDVRSRAELVAKLFGRT